MDEFKLKWEEWYADMLTAHQWNELDYEGRKILYVCGTTRYTGDEGDFSSNFVQVIGWTDSGEHIVEEERDAILEILKSHHGMDNVSFWSV